MTKKSTRPATTCRPDTGAGDGWVHRSSPVSVRARPVLALVNPPYGPTFRASAFRNSGPPRAGEYVSDIDCREAQSPASSVAALGGRKEEAVVISMPNIRLIALGPVSTMTLGLAGGLCHEPDHTFYDCDER